MQKISYKSDSVQITVGDLTPRQKDLFRKIRPRSGVLNLRGKAGIAKSATSKAIADNVFVSYIQVIETIENGQVVDSKETYIQNKPLQYLDLRLSQMDETHFGFPYRRNINIGGNQVEVMDCALPEWFHACFESPTFINFEELNRCSQDVQNAALEILNERTLHGHKLPDFTFMISTGNLGQEDGCNVNPFDTAMISRLINHDFEMNIDEWCSAYAERLDEEGLPNVVEAMTSFIKGNPNHFYTDITKMTVGEPFACPRSLTNLSHFLKNLGKRFIQAGGTEEQLDSLFAYYVTKNGSSYVGAGTAAAFSHFLQSRVRVTIVDVLNGSADLKEIYDSRADQSRLVDVLKKPMYLNIENMEQEQVDNLAKFFEVCQPDILTAYFQAVFKGDGLDSEKKFSTSLSPAQIKIINEHINSNPDLKAKLPNFQGSLRQYWDAIGDVPPSFKYGKMYKLLKNKVFKPCEMAMAGAVSSNKK